MLCSDEVHAHFWATTRLSQTAVRQLAEADAARSGTFDFTRNLFDYAQVGFIDQRKSGTMLRITSGLGDVMMTLLVAIARENNKTSIAVGVRGTRAPDRERPMFATLRLGSLTGLPAYKTFLRLLADGIYEADGAAVITSTLLS